MDEVLFFLLKNGGGRRKIRVATAELGRAVGMSQQNASRRLGLLAAQGVIERKDGIRITPLGMKVVGEEYEVLSKAIKGGSIRFDGRVSDGFGRGRYYLSLPGYRKEIGSKLGFEPYPGTLNLKLDKRDIRVRSEILKQEPIVIGGFRTRERTYGDLFAYPCKAGGLGGAIIFPLRSNHPQDIIEIISGVNLRKALKKASGGRVAVEA
ncbi:CTP-dependent riboflavin kinase [Candidatus Micrarchaeota archaeon]|nr:CTP-dependent riboflavin kinase [Candidatus Micrarchaeota archaeon]